MSAFEGKVLFVAANSEWEEIYGREALRSAIEDVEFLNDADKTIDRLVDLYERDDLPAAIFSDGLNGGWRAIAKAAKAERIPTFVISGNPTRRADIESEGATFIYKGTLELGFVGVALAGLHPVATA